MFHPLLVFADGYLLGARLRPGDVGGATHLRPLLEPIVAHLRRTSCGAGGFISPPAGRGSRSSPPSTERTTRAPSLSRRSRSVPSVAVASAVSGTGACKRCARRAELIAARPDPRPSSRSAVAGAVRCCPGP